MLPLVDLPAGWTVGKSGPRHLETFNAENLSISGGFLNTASIDLVYQNDRASGPGAEGQPLPTLRSDGHDSGLKKSNCVPMSSSLPSDRRASVRSAVEPREWPDRAAM